MQDYLAAMPGWKQGVGRGLDRLVERTVPGVRKAVRWNSPFYGIEGRGWFRRPLDGPRNDTSVSPVSPRLFIPTYRSSRSRLNTSSGPTGYKRRFSGVPVTPA